MNHGSGTSPAIPRLDTTGLAELATGAATARSARLLRQKTDRRHQGKFEKYVDAFFKTQPGLLKKLPGPSDGDEKWGRWEGWVEVEKNGQLLYQIQELIKNKSIGVEVVDLVNGRHDWTKQPLKEWMCRFICQLKNHKRVRNAQISRWEVMKQKHPKILECIAGCDKSYSNLISNKTTARR